jgi:hypothetical protein
MKRREVLFSLVCERRRARSRPQRTRDLARPTVRATSARAGTHCSVHASTFARPLSNAVRMWGRAPDLNSSPACISGRVMAQCSISIQLRRACYICGRDADRCGQSSETTDADPDHAVIEETERKCVGRAPMSSASAERLWQPGRP